MAYLAFQPLFAFSLLDYVQDLLKRNLHFSGVPRELLDNKWGSLFGVQYLSHCFLESLAFLVHLKADLQALYFGIGSDGLVQVHKATTYSCDEIAVPDYDLLSLGANEILARFQLYDWQDQAKALIYL